MGDTRPPEELRMPWIEEIRLRVARHQPHTEAEGELVTGAMMLLAAVDHVMNTHRPQPSLYGGCPVSCITCGFDDARLNVPWECPTIAGIREVGDNA